MPFLPFLLWFGLAILFFLGVASFTVMNEKQRMVYWIIASWFVQAVTGVGQQFYVDKDVIVIHDCPAMAPSPFPSVLKFSYQFSKVAVAAINSIAAIANAITMSVLIRNRYKEKKLDSIIISGFLVSLLVLALPKLEILLVLLHVKHTFTLVPVILACYACFQMIMELIKDDNQPPRQQEVGLV